MDLNSEQPKIVNYNEIITIKRKLETKTESNKRIKVNEIPEKLTVNQNEDTQTIGKQNITSRECRLKTDLKEKINIKHKQNLSIDKEKETAKGTKNYTNSPLLIPNSPKKRLEVQSTKKKKFIYGNYSQYYGYRNKDKANHDVRLDVFAEHRGIFRNKQVLDIGCNSGFITMEVAKQFDIKSIVGLDIDKSLINQAIKTLTKYKKNLPMDNELKRLHKFPFNANFVHGNYVLKDDVLLEIETEQFDVILCLSITKWIHLNFGDKGLKQAFKRIFLQLKSQGKLILEPQPFDNYGRRKKMTDSIFKNFKDMQFLPKEFTEYLLSQEVGFRKMELLGVPDHCEMGFKRPIQVFFKD